jgi:aminoglycoside 6'-N-acetyltransferase I
MSGLLFDRIKAFIAIRKSRPVLQHGLYRQLLVTMETLAFSRESGQERAVVVLVNAAKAECTMTLNETVLPYNGGSLWTDIENKESFQSTDGSLRIPVPGHSIRFLEAGEKYDFVQINESEETMREAALMLHESFTELGIHAWPDFGSAMNEVKECIEPAHICIGIKARGKLAGWAGARKLYDQTWELHPCVIKKEYRNRGMGKILIAELESEARFRGVIGLVLGTDDETGATSISQIDLDGDNIFTELAAIKNLKNHPYEFYQKCGYRIIGAIPNASGPRKPDIWMWKDIRE